MRFFCLFSIKWRWANAFKIRLEEHNTKMLLPNFQFLPSSIHSPHGTFFFKKKEDWVCHSPKPFNGSSTALRIIHKIVNLTCKAPGVRPSLSISPGLPSHSTTPPAWTIFQFLKSTWALEGTSLSSLDVAPPHSLGLTLNTISLESPSLCPPLPNPCSHCTL